MARNTAAAAAEVPTVRIRMYRVGFGDCFLLTFPGQPKRHVLIDCGVHSQGDLGTIADAVADIATETGKALDLVIATHAHQDHISGFGKCATAFKEFRVGEVWMPWTENSDDPVASQLRQKQAALVQRLTMHFAAVPASSAARAAVQNLVGNAPALALLKSGISGGRVTYIKAGGTIENVAGIPGLTARLLGPPTDQGFLARMDPPKGDRFMRLGGTGPEEVDPIQPFDKSLWAVDAGAYPPGLLPASDCDTLAGRTQDMDGLAFSLTNAMNNTSVVTLFSYRGKNLLFPGDAQYGNWQSWTDDPAAKSILEQVDFYKVAHHGSVNATPKSALDGMTPHRFAAMMSTQETPWPSIPYGNLLKALMERSCGLARSDSIQVPQAPTADAPLSPLFTVGPIWCDYAIALG